MRLYYFVYSHLPFSALVREAVQEHHADVVIVDGISTREEAHEVCVAVRRGVAVVASVSQCATLRSLFDEADLSELLGQGDPSKCVFGIQSVRTN
jgi:stage III sporulation protein SpoIIIAA